MLARLLVSAALAASVSVAAFGGTCDCKDEVENASAQVTGSCSKLWSNNHCTLKENGSSTSQALLQFSDDRHAGIKHLSSTLRQIPYIDASTDYDSDKLARHFFSFDYIRNAMTNCVAGKSIDPLDLVVVLIDPALRFENEGSIVLWLDGSYLSSLLETVISKKIGESMCTSRVVEHMDFSGGLVFYGQGCIAHGNEETNVLVNLRDSIQCSDGIDF